MWRRAQRYYQLRGLPWREWPPHPEGNKLAEEAQELVDALRSYNERQGPQAAVHEEIADVAISLAWIAHCHGTTIEDCIDMKTLKDRGRGAGAHYLEGK